MSDGLKRMDLDIRKRRYFYFVATGWGSAHCHGLAARSAQ